MAHVLIPVDPAHPARARSAVEQAARLCREEPTSVRLLRVQPPVSGQVAMYFDAQALQQLQLEWGTEALRPVEALLTAAGVPFTSTVRLGRSAPTIAAVAREFHCDRVVFGNDEPGLAGRLFGTLAQQVRHLLDAQGDPQVIGS